MVNADAHVRFSEPARERASAKLVAGVIAWLLLLVPLGQCGAQEDVLDEIRAAWEARQARFETFIIEYEVEVTTMAGEEGMGLPLADTTVLDSYRFVSDGNKGRLDQVGKVWSFEDSAYIDVEHPIVFDGQERRTYYLQSNVKYTPGFYVPDGSLFDQYNWLHQPLIVNFRPAMDKFGGGLDGWEVVDEPATVDGLSCIVLQHGRMRMWVDEEHFLLRRRELFKSNGTTVVSVTAGYRDDAEHGMLCDTWSFVHFSDVTRQPRRISVARVVDYELNVPVAPEEFELHFPPGALIVNQRTDQHAIVRDDGSWRQLTKGEMVSGIPYEELALMPELAEALPMTDSLAPTYSRWVYFGLILVVVGCVAFWLRSRRSQIQPSRMST